MQKNEVIEEAVENIMEYTGVYRDIYNSSNTERTLEEIESYQEGVRESIRGILCKVAVASSRDMNLAQLCVARGIKH
jgi:hypothetical protein